MGVRFGPGPVFAAECRRASRRVPFYGARVLLVLGLLAALGLVWAAEGHRHEQVTLQNLARIGNSFYRALMGVELAMALLIAPAAAAGAICQDRAGGGLALLMTTDLTDSEIVLGRLASRLLSTLGVVACGLPVLALSTLLGGVDPVAVVGATMVVVGVACLGVAMALAFSLRAGKAHEALAATYVAWMIGLSAFPICYGLDRQWADWLRWSNPIALIYSEALPAVDRLPYQAAFLGGCLAGTAALAGLSTWRLRAVTLHRRIKRTRKARPSRRQAPAWLRRIGQASPSLDDDPILWREWHRMRPSPFARAIWWTYAVVFGILTLVFPFGPRLAPLINALQVSVGLLLASVGAATSLAEERGQGGLDVVLASPVDSRRIVLGKWWGAFRIVPRLAILPALLVLRAGFDGAPLWGLPVALVVVGLVLAYGAVVTGLGLLIAIREPRQGRAVALSVACYLGVTIAYPAIVLPIHYLGPNDSLPLWPSPFFGIFVPTLHLDWGNSYNLAQGLGFLAFEAAVAYGLLQAALRGFDRGLGRVADRPGAAGRTAPRPDPISRCS